MDTYTSYFYVYKVFVKYTLIMAITTKGVLDWILYEKAGSDHC